MGVGQVSACHRALLPPLLLLQANLPPLPAFCRKHDGRATLEDFIALADLCQRRSKCYQSFEFTAQMQGFCSLKLWQAMCGPDGQEQFVNWYVCASSYFEP